MALTNEFLAAIVSILSIVSTIVGALYFYHSKNEEQYCRLFQKLEQIEASIVRLDKEMLRYSDPLLQNVLQAFNNRFDAIENDVSDLNDHTQSTRAFIPVIGGQLVKDVDDIKGLLNRHEKIISKIAMRKSDKF